MTEATMEEIMYIFSSILHPSQRPGMILRAYDKEGSPTMIHVEDPSYTIVISWEAYEKTQGWIDSHSAVNVSRSQRSVRGVNGYEDVDIAILELHSFTAFKMLRNALTHRRIVIMIDSWVVDGPKSASFISNIGLPSLCAWYAIDCRHAITDTKRGDSLPTFFTKSELSTTTRFLRITKKHISQASGFIGDTYPLKTAYLALHTTEQSSSGQCKRKMDGASSLLEDRFRHGSMQWQDCPVTIGGMFYDSSTPDEIVDASVIMSDDAIHALTLSTCPHLISQDADQTVYSEERQLLCDLSKKILEINPDVIIVYDINNDVSKLKKRFESLHLSDHLFSAIFSKLNGCPVKVMDDDLLRCNNLMSCNLSLSQLYHKTNGDMVKVNQLKHKLKSKAPQHPHVVGFGVAVLSAKQWLKGMTFDSPLDICKAMMTSNQIHHHVENFQYQVRISGTNFVSYNGSTSHVRPSEVYNLNVGREMVASKLALVPTMSQHNTPIHGGLVLDPHPCFTFDPIVTLDFESMYASIIETFNFCSTTLTDVESGQTYRTVVDGISCFAHNARQGILPKILKEWKHIRSQARSCKGVVVEVKDKAMYATRERAIKSCIVSMIGQNMCLSEDLPFTDRVLANVVTKTGRHMLQEVEKLVPRFDHPSLTGPPAIIAGDTDSCFVRLPLRSSHIQHTDMSEMWKKKIEVTQIATEALRDMVRRGISDVVQSWTDRPTENHLNMKWEGSSFCSIHFPLKKRYVHCETDNHQTFKIKTKGVTSIHSTAIPIEADLEEKALGIAICGWYLCMRKGVRFDYPDVLPPTKLSDATDIMSVFMPGHGWLQDVSVERVDGEDGVFQVRVSDTKDLWARTFYKDESGIDVGIDFLTGENKEKKLRCSQVIELLRTKMTMVKNGQFSITELIQSKAFRGYEQDGDRYCNIAATVGRTRAMFGLRSPRLHKDVQYVHVDQRQKARYDWHQSLITAKYLDPILAMREGIHIDVGWYISRLLDLVLFRDCSLIAVMTNDTIGYGKGYLDSVRQEMTALLDGSRSGGVSQCVRRLPLSQLPQGIRMGRIDLHNLENMISSMGDCLLGSIFDTDLQCVNHFYVRPEKAYHKEVLEFCQSLSQTHICY